MIVLPDFKLTYLAAQLADAIYETDIPTLTAKVKSLGCMFLGYCAIEDAQAMVVVTPDAWQNVVTRGTQVLSGGTVPARAHELADDANPQHTDLSNGASVRSGAYDPFKVLWESQISKLIDVTKPIRFIGHSLGGQRSCYGPLMIPWGSECQIIAFAPPKAGNAAFWALLEELCPKLLIVGRLDDFAPAWCPLDGAVMQYDHILHFKNAGWEWLDHWPWYDDSIPDHSADDYVSDAKILAETSP